MKTQLPKNVLRCSRFIALLFAAVICSGAAFAQNRQLSGTVKDTNGAPVEGAAVRISGRNAGTTTNAKGEFEFKGIAPNPVIVVTRLGMKSQTVAVGDKTRVEIVLQEDATQLEEMVAIGYGTQKKSDLTGSLAGIKSDDITSTAVTSLEQSLTGRISGVRVLQDNSPGGGVSIQIRGTNSMLGGTEPLYVVDGMPLDPVSDAQGNSTAGESVAQSSMNYINPDDIASIEVLKDASATAIYGARGANGVVLITTKSGQSGKSQVTYNFRNEVATVSRKIPLMNSDEFCTMLNQKELNRYYLESTKPDFTGNVAPINIPYDGIKNPLPWDMPTTDWQDAIFRTAFSQNHSIQIQGASGKDDRYFISLGLRNQQGVIIQSNYRRYSLNASFDKRISPKFRISNKFNGSYSEANGTTASNGEVFANRSVTTGAMLMQPIFALNKESDDPNEDEDYGDFNGNYNVNNPYRLATQLTDKKTSYTAVENLSGIYEVNKSLSLTGRLGVNYANNGRFGYWPRTLTRGKAADGIATISSLQTFKYVAEARANYDKTIGQHTFGAMGAFTYEDNNKTTKYDTYAGFPSDDLSYHGVNDASAQYPTQMNWYENKLMSFIGRLNYTYKQRYLATATFRADGSTRFAENKKWGYFPSFALAWRISQEDFLRRSNIVDDLKLRASYGQTGSESGIDPYMSLGKLKTSPYSFNDNVAHGYTESNIPNPYLTWETTDQYNLGTDVSLFKSRISMTIDLYYKITRDLLQSVKMPGSFGYTTKIMNMGRVDNKGLEFEITAPVVRKKNVSLTLTANGAFNRNKLVSLGTRSFIDGPSVGSFQVNRFMVGQPLGVFWGLQWQGVYSDWDQALASGIYNATPGEYRFANNSVEYQTNPDGSFVLDANGKKVPLAVQHITVEDMTKIGNPNPDFTYGFSVAFTYKKFDFNMLLTGQVGGKLYWNDYALMVQQQRNYNSLEAVASDSWIAPLQYTFTSNGKTYTIGSAEGNTQNAKYPSPRANNGAIANNNDGTGQNTTVYRNTMMNSSLLFDASYLKVSMISIGYNFSIPHFAKSARASVSVDNLYTFTSYPGYDPASTSFVKSPMRQGIDIGSYPSQRNYVFTLSLNF